METMGWSGVQLAVDVSVAVILRSSQLDGEFAFQPQREPRNWIAIGKE
jgi:hypothetical protein